MRLRVAAVLLLAFAASVSAADDKEKEKDDAEKKAPSLAIGDPAPPLSVTKWLQGAEVKTFEPGKAYVVEFWATWCGPCIVMMPHVSDLQDQFRDKGVTIVGFSPKDPNNSAEKVEEFVEKRGKKLHYTLAYADDRKTYDDYMKAAKRNGIPCSFVVDKAGKIAFIGHPMLLDDVLPKVVAGTWNGKNDAAEVEKGMDEWGEVTKAGRNDPEAGLKAFEEFRQKRPNLAKSIFMAPMKLSLLVKAEKLEEAKTEAELMLAEAKKREDAGGYGRVASILSSPNVKASKPLQELAIQAAQSAVKIQGDKDLASLLTLAEAYFAAGDKAKAKATAAQALDAAEPRMKKFVEARVKKYDDEKKDEKKDDDKKN